jgi:hypothetical protein
MAGMLRMKDDKEFAALLKGTHLRIHSDTIGGRAPPVAKQASNPARSATKAAAPPSANEELLAGQISAVGNLPAPERQYHHLRGRGHTLDFAWPEWTVNGMQLGVEVQGMCHTVKGRFNADIEKRALGVLQGYLILEVGPDQIKSGKAMEWLQELFQKATRRST